MTKHSIGPSGRGLDAHLVLLQFSITSQHSPQYVCYSKFTYESYIGLCLKLFSLWRDANYGFNSYIPHMATSRSSFSAKQCPKPQRTSSPSAHVAHTTTPHFTASSQDSWSRAETSPSAPPRIKQVRNQCSISRSRKVAHRSITRQQ